MSSDRYAAWIADQIAQHEPCQDRNALIRLAEATAALTTGAGLVFGMLMPPNLPDREALSAAGLAMLKMWIPKLDPVAVEQLAEVASRAHLDLDLSDLQAAHAERRRAEVDARIAKSQSLDTRYSDLERAIVENPADREAWLVLADAFQSKGDPRGELIALEIAGEAEAGKRKAAKAYFTKHREALVGKLAALELLDDEAAFTWRRGFIAGAMIGWRTGMADGAVRAAVEDVLRHAAGRFLEDLAIGFDDNPAENVLQGAVDAIAELSIPTLRRLHLGYFEYPDSAQIMSRPAVVVADLTELWRALPRLQKIVMYNKFTLGEIVHDKLEHVEVRSKGLPGTVARSVSAAELPALRHLEIWYGAETLGGDTSFLDIAPLLTRHDLPALRYLGLKSCEFTDEICDGIAKTRLLRQLEVLDLSMGTMSDAGVDAILQSAAAFRHLKRIDVSNNWITGAALTRLRALGPEIVDGGQQAGNNRNVTLGAAPT
jgi:uncharacterized protein (TIGR02996 family)